MLLQIGIFIAIGITVIFVGVYAIKKHYAYKRETSSKGYHILKAILKAGLPESRNESAPTNIEELGERMIKVLKTYFGFDYITFFTYDRDNDSICILASNVGQGHIRYLEEYANEIFQEIKGKSGAHIEKAREPDSIIEYPTSLVRKINNYFFIPLTISNAFVGALLIENKVAGNRNTKNFLDWSKEDFFTVVTDYYSVIIQNLEYLHRIEQQASVDGLTLAYNRLYMENYFPQLLNHAKKLKKKLALVILDIDHFKKVNDENGHLLGDYCLKLTARLIKSNLSKNQILARFGGEEFVCICPDISVEDAYIKFDGIRNLLSKMPIEKKDGSKVNITASFGISEYSNESDSLVNLIERADTALYKAKETGRNKVLIYNTDMGIRKR